MKRIKLLTSILLLTLLAGCSGLSQGDGKGSDQPPISDLPEEKEVTFEIEGNQETMILQRYVGKNFSMYIDQNSFTVQESEEEVKFTVISPDPQIYPEVSIAVTYDQESSIEKAAESLLKNESFSYENGQEIGSKTALRFHAGPGSDAKWDSPIQDIYLIDGDEGYFTITVIYFLEASEGWGARMIPMINTFVPNDL